MIQLFRLILTLVIVTVLAGCGTDSSSGRESGIGSGSTATKGVTVSGVSTKKPAFSLLVTDAPIDDMVAVVVSFTEVSVLNASNQLSSYQFDTPRSIDLLELQGSVTADLLINMPLDDGEYREIRLLFDDAPMANYVDLGAAGLFELEVINGSTEGITIEGDFNATSSRPASLVIDFDLRQSIISPAAGVYQFDPQARLVSQSDSNHIRGVVDPALLSSATDCSDGDVDTFNAVYVYNGHDATLEDIDLGKKTKKSKKTKKTKKTKKSTKTFGPASTTVVKYDADSMTYLYEAAFLSPGDYTVAVTCNADLEDLYKSGDNLRFFGVRNATVKVNDILFL